MSVSGFLKLFIGNQIDLVLLLVCGCQVNCEDLNSYTVYKYKRQKPVFRLVTGNLILHN